MQVREAAVESRQLPFAASRELGEVRIGYLSVTDDTTDFYFDERDNVGPELVAVRRLDRADDITRGCRGLPRAHQESINERTSSEVTTVPTLTRGNPVLRSSESAAVRPAPRPRRMRSATVSLSVRWVSRAIASACLCRSSGRSIVVRTPNSSIVAS